VQRIVIYTTNVIESLHAAAQDHEIIKNRGDFLNDDTAIKLTWLALRISPMARYDQRESGSLR